MAALIESGILHAMTKQRFIGLYNAREDRLRLEAVANHCGPSSIPWVRKG